MVTVDEEDGCLLLYSHIALLDDFNSALSGLTFVAFGLANSTARIDPKVMKPMLALDGFLFFFTMLNTLSSDAFEWGSTTTSFPSLNKRSNWYFLMQSFISSIYPHISSVVLGFFHQSNYNHSANLNLEYHDHWAFDNQETGQKEHLTWLDHSSV